MCVPNRILRDTGTLPGKEGGMGSRTLGSAVLWEEAPCSLVDVYQRFGRTVSMETSLLLSAELLDTAWQQTAISHIQSSKHLNSCVFCPVFSWANGGVSIWGGKKNCRCIHDNGSLGRGLLLLIQSCSHAKGVSRKTWLVSALRTADGFNRSLASLALRHKHLIR